MAGGARIQQAKPCLTVLAQMPVPRKDVIIDGMAKSTLFSSMNLIDEFYQISMREKDIEYNAVSTPSGMLWEWLVIPQGLSNGPTKFNRCVTNMLRSIRNFDPSYFDDVFVRIRQWDGHPDVEVHRLHARKILTRMRNQKLYAKLKNCLFGKYHFLVASWVNMAYCPTNKDQGDHQLASVYRYKRTLEVPRLSGVFSQVFAQLSRDDCSSLSFIEEKTRSGYGVPIL